MQARRVQLAREAATPQRRLHEVADEQRVLEGCLGARADAEAKADRDELPRDKAAYAEAFGRRDQACVTRGGGLARRGLAMLAQQLVQRVPIGEAKHAPIGRAKPPTHSRRQMRAQSALGALLPSARPAQTVPRGLWQDREQPRAQPSKDGPHAATLHQQSCIVLALYLPWPRL